MQQFSAQESFLIETIRNLTKLLRTDSELFQFGDFPIDHACQSRPSCRSGSDYLRKDTVLFLFHFADQTDQEHIPTITVDRYPLRGTDAAQHSAGKARRTHDFQIHENIGSHIVEGILLRLQGKLIRHQNNGVCRHPLSDRFKHEAVRLIVI